MISSRCPQRIAAFPWRGKIAAAWARENGRHLPALLFYRVMAMFRLAVVLMWLKRRWREGGSQDSHVAGSGKLAEGLLALAICERDEA